MKHLLRCSGIAVLVTLLAPAAVHAQRWVDANFRPTSGLGGGETETFRGLEDQYLDRHVVTAIGMAEARDKPNVIVLRIEPMGCPEARNLPTSCGDDTWTVTLRASDRSTTGLLGDAVAERVASLGPFGSLDGWVHEHMQGGYRVLYSGDGYITGLQVCLNRGGNRIKGLRIFTSEANLWGHGEPVSDEVSRRGNAGMREFARANCRTPWKAKQVCIGKRMMVGLRARHSTGAFHGLDLLCGRVQVPPYGQYNDR